MKILPVSRSLPCDGTAAEVVLRELDKYLEMEDGEEKTQIDKRLRKKMRYAHLWISTAGLKHYNEAGKSLISINTAAIKHILIKAGLERRDPRVFSPICDWKFVVELMRDVFLALGNARVTNAAHALLCGLEVCNFSVCASVADDRYRLIKDICRQCNTILSETMTEVSYHSILTRLSQNIPYEVKCQNTPRIIKSHWN